MHRNFFAYQHLSLELFGVVWNCKYMGLQMQGADRAKREEAVQKWQTSARKAQRYADACYAEAQAKADEAAEATAQVITCAFFSTHPLLCSITYQDRPM